MLHPGGGGGIDAPAGGDRAGERDLGHARIGHQRLPDRACALQDVVKAGGQAGLGQDLGQAQGAERCGLGGLEHHRIAAGECGRTLPGGDLGGIVPGPDADADAQRLADRVDEIPPEGDVIAGQRGGEAAEIFERIGGRGGIGHQRLGQRLAGVEGFEHGEVMVAGADEVGRAAQDAPAFDRAQGRPVALGAGGGGKRAVDQRRGGGAQGGDGRPGRGIDDGQRLARRVLDKGAVDVVRGGGLGVVGHQASSWSSAARTRAVARRPSGGRGERLSCK